MRIGDIIDQGLDGLFGLLLPDEVVERVIDPLSDIAGAVADGVTGRADGVAKHALDLAEDVAQWAGKNELASRIDHAAQFASGLLQPPLAAAKGHATASPVVARAVGAAVGAGAGAAQDGERGMKAGWSQGAALAGRLERLTRADLASSQAAVAAAGAAMHTGGIAVGLHLASESAVWRQNGRLRNLDAFQWAAGAGGAAGEMLESGRAAVTAKQTTAQEAATIAGLGAKAGAQVVHGLQIEAQRSPHARTRGLDAAAKVLDHSPEALEWLAKPAAQEVDERVRVEEKRRRCWLERPA